MRIGILTHHYIDNYGAFLQTYALQNTVSKLFPNDEVEIINYINLKHFIINVGGWFRFYKDRECMMHWIKKIHVPLTFSKERKKEFSLSKLCINANQVNQLKYDCIIIGSDEVWNYKDKKSSDSIKFGVGLKCQKLISYAPSVGKVPSDAAPPKYVQVGIKNFSAVSVRDELTYELVLEISDKTPVKVLDPTFLCEFPRAKMLAKRKPYILFYYCEHLPRSVSDYIFDYAASNGLAVYGAGECDKRYSEITVDLTPFEWIEMFRNAEFVFTGTFHGVVFSILNRRQFKVYLTNESRTNKVNSLLRDFNINCRELTADFKFDLEKAKDEIDYEEVFQIIEIMREQSENFLHEKIKK